MLRAYHILDLCLLFGIITTADGSNVKMRDHMKEIYLDNAATTFMPPEVIDIMERYSGTDYGNPSALYEKGRNSRKALDHVRGIIADTVNAREDEIIFTSGGTESDNWAVKCIPYLEALRKGMSSAHIITSSIEHHAVLNPLRQLEDIGYNVTYLPVDRYGRVSPKDFGKALRHDTVFATIMTANNEIGTVEPVNELAGIAKKAGIVFHTDAVQAYGHIPVDVKESGIGMMSVSAHKFHGPRGCGFMYISKELKSMWESEIELPLIAGGGQEYGLRSGTENLASIAAMGKAAVMSCREVEKDGDYVRTLREYCYDKLKKNIPEITMNGDPVNRLPGNLNISIKGIEARSLMLLAGEQGLYISTASACSQKDTHSSHVLKAIGLSSAQAGEAIRISVCRYNTREEIDDAVKILSGLVNKLRSYGGY